MEPCRFRGLEGIGRVGVRPDQNIEAGVHAASRRPHVFKKCVASKIIDEGGKREGVQLVHSEGDPRV